MLDGVYNVLTDALYRIFKGECLDTPGMGCVAFLQYLPLFYFSLKDRQKKNPFPVNLRDKIQCTVCCALHSTQYKRHTGSCCHTTAKQITM